MFKLQCWKVNLMLPGSTLTEQEALTTISLSLMMGMGAALLKTRGGCNGPAGNKKERGTLHLARNPLTRALKIAVAEAHRTCYIKIL